MLRLSVSAFIGLFFGFMTIVPLHAQETGGAQEPAREDNETPVLDDDLTPPRPFQIVGFGDSLMAGYRLTPDKSFTAQLETLLQSKNYNVSVINSGVSGDTTTGGRERIDWSVPDGTGLVILELGANDMLRGIDAKVTEENLDFMLARLQNRKIPVIFVGMKSAPNFGKEKAAQFESIYARLAAKYKVTFYPFFLDGVAGQPGLQLNDGKHPNEKGVALMVEKMAPVIEQKLNELGVTHQ